MIENPLLFEWLSEYEVGHPDIDHQHRKLAKLYNRFILSFKKPIDVHEVRNAFAAIVIYTEVHFTMEENLMRGLNYPDIDRHILSHKSFTADIHSMLEKFENDEIDLHQLLYETLLWSPKVIDDSEDRLLGIYLKTMHL